MEQPEILTDARIRPHKMVAGRRSPAKDAAMGTVHKSFCRNCTHSCGMAVTIEDGRAVEIKPDHDHAISDGYLCIKASMNLELHEGADGRLTGALKRQPDGSFAAIDSSTAIDEAGDKLKAILDTYGPRSIGLYYGTGGYFSSFAWPMAKAWMAAVGSPNICTSSTVDQSSRWVTLMRMGILNSGKPGPDEMDALMFVGVNPLASHWLAAFNPAKRLREWRKQGRKIIVIDPRRTETARLADMFVQVRPGEDVALFAGMIRILLEQGWQDAAFCERYVGGIDVLRAAVAPFTAALVEERVGVPPEMLTEAVRALACSGRGMVLIGTGVTMTPHSNLATHLAEALNALIGGYRRVGDPVANPGILKPRRYSDAIFPPNRPWESGFQCRSTPTGLIYGEVPTGALPGEILTPGPDKIRAMVIFGGNPLKALGQPEKTLRAFRDLDLLVCIDARMNDTAQLADYAIGCTLPLERHDMTMIFDNLGWSPRPFLQYAEPLVAPPPEVVDDCYFFWALARRMGLQLEYRNTGTGTHADAAPGLKLDMDVPPDPADLARWLLAGTSVDFEDLRAHPGGVTPDLPVQRVEAVEDDGVRLDLCPADVAAELAGIAAAAPDSAHRYRLTTRRMLEAMNSAYHGTAGNRRRFPTNPALMNPDDMAREGISAGDRVEIASAHGALIAEAQPDRNIGGGTIAIAQCWGATDPARDPDQRQGSFTGRLISLDADVEPINHMPWQTGIGVSVRPLARA